MGTQPRDLPSDTRGINKQVDLANVQKAVALMKQHGAHELDIVRAIEGYLVQDEAGKWVYKQDNRMKHRGTKAPERWQQQKPEVWNQLQDLLYDPRVTDRGMDERKPTKTPSQEYGPALGTHFQQKHDAEMGDIRQDLWPHNPWLTNKGRLDTINEYKVLDPNARDAYREKHFDNYNWPEGQWGDLHKNMIETGKVPRE